MLSRLERVHNSCCILAGLLLLTLPSVAQMEVGDAKMNLNGNIGFNYAGGMNGESSDHSLGFSGNGNLTGNYYNPNFLNFNVQPFYNREQTDSLFGSLTNTGGVTSNVNLFSGSHFPGSISYNKLINSTGQFGVPGSGVGLAEHGNTQGFGVGWSEGVPDWPMLMASYAINSGSNSIYGLQDKSTDSSHTFNLLSTYELRGYRLTGGYTHRNVDDSISNPLGSDEGPIRSNSSSNYYQANVSHSFPMSGAYGVSWNRVSYDYGSQDSASLSNSGASDNVNGTLVFTPMRKMNLAFDANYTDNLLGNVPQPILGSGTAINVTSLGTFRSFLVGADANYQLLKNLNVHADVNHQQQEFLGQSYGATQFGGSANYNFEHKLFGHLSFSVGVVDTANQYGNTGLGFVGTLNYARKVVGWEVDANVSYAQNVATQMLIYTTSSFNYITNARRRLGARTYFMAGVSGEHSGISANAGSSNSAERISSVFIYHAYNLNGFYSKSHGEAIFTPTGLVAVPTTLPTSIFLPNSLIAYDSKGWGLNASTLIRRKLTISMGYASYNGSTVDPLLSTFTKTELINGIMQYRLRKIFLNAGYTRLKQRISTPGAIPVNVTTYYIGFSRWFNFF